jgi:hypothetical protein
MGPFCCVTDGVPGGVPDVVPDVVPDGVPEDVAEVLLLEIETPEEPLPAELEPFFTDLAFFDPTTPPTTATMIMTSTAIAMMMIPLVVA